MLPPKPIKPTPVVQPIKPTPVVQQIIKWQDIPYLNVSGELRIDPADTNKGVVTPAGITFGSKSLEGISSNRTGTMNPSGLDFYTAGAARLSIDSKGHVGIGTSSPSAALHIFQGQGATGQALLLTSSGPGPGSGIRLHNATGKTYEIFSGGGSLHVTDVNANVDRLIVDQNGNVGIGTDAPKAKLDVAKGDIRWGNNSQLMADQGGSIELGGNNTTPGVGIPYIDFHFGNGLTQDFNTRIINDANERLSLLARILFLSGNVGIGVFPLAALHVKGDVIVTGDISLQNSDCAEDFDVAGTVPVEPGTVMVIATDGALMASQQAYDKRVAGVVSGAGDLRPGIILGRQGEKANRLPLALTGRVYCKIDAQYGPVEVGDLLTTSPTYGHAMKATDHQKTLGTIIGKALRGLEAGKGLIPILVALQ